LDVDETIFTPVGVPRVSDDPVRTSRGINIPTDNLDAVVKLIAAGRGDNASVIILPGGSIDADAQGTVGHHGSLHGSFVGRLSSISKSRNLNEDFATVVSARSTFSRFTRSVGVRGFALKTVLLDVLEGSGQVTTVASAVSGIAINNLLGSEDDSLTLGQNPGGFSSFSGRESPARS
jgi:hypothetical protein